MTEKMQSFRAPGRVADRLAVLRGRQRVTDVLRAWFRAEDFVEVETAILQVSPGNEVHLHAPAVTVRDAGGRSAQRYLRTSPEFAAKKLLADGVERLFEFARVFRDREEGPLHLREFTMLEWYRVQAPLETVMEDTLSLLRLAAETTQCRTVSWRGRHADPSAPAERISVAEAFDRYAGIDVAATVSDGIGDRTALASAAISAGIRVADDDDWSDIFSRILVAKIEPSLGNGRPTFLYDYPAPEAALARRAPGRPDVALRFELYLAGIELANGYDELTDAAEQQRRFMAAMDERERRYGERYPVDPAFIEAVGRMRQASGVALGFDRLVMALTGAPSLDHVVWTPQGGGL